MKKALLTLLVIVPILASAQSEIGIGFAGNFATQRPSGVDVLSSGGGLAFFAHSIKIKGALLVQPQIQIVGNRYIMDGVFSRSPLGYNFDVTPAGVKQAMLTMYSVKVPVLIREKLIENKSNKGFASLGVGPYMEYIFSAKQKMKVGNDNFIGKPPIEHLFNGGLMGELTIGSNSKLLSNPLSLTCGMSYQLTDYISDRASFKPLSVYLRIGVGI